MRAQLPAWFLEQIRSLARWLGLIAVLLLRGAALLWRGVRPTLLFALNVLLALLLLFEEWGWRPLSNLLAQLARFPLWARAELWIAGLPPYGALTALAVPSTIVIPTKLIGVYLLATGHIVTATAIILGAKLAGTALVARIFVLTKPSLMQIGWFARAHDGFVPWQERTFGWIRNSRVWRYGRVVKWRATSAIRRSWVALRPRLAGVWLRLEPQMNALGARMRAGGRDLYGRSALGSRRLLRRLESLADLRRR